MTDRVRTVRVTLGDDVARVARKSTYDLSSNVRSVSDINLVAVTEPAALAYDGAGRSVVLPEGRFISLDVNAGGGVPASSHLQALPLRDAVVLARDIGALLADVGRWQAAGDDVVLRLKQVRSAPDGPNGRRYLLSVEFENLQILQERLRAVSRLRDPRPAS